MNNQRLQTIAQVAKKIKQEQKPVLTEGDLSTILQSEYSTKPAEYSEQRNELNFN